MKKCLVFGVSFLLFLAITLTPSFAVTIDTSGDWDGNINSGWRGSGQSITVDSVDSFFDDITFFFSEFSAGLTFDLILSDAANGGSTLFSTSFVVSEGANLIDINQALAPNSVVYALIDYNGFSGQTAHFIGTDVYAGGNSYFGPFGSYDAYLNMDHRFIANFSQGGGGNAVPEPATMILFGLGLIGMAGVARKK